jgi:hypothetical protein
LHIVRRDPQVFGYHQSRWTLRMLLTECHWLRLNTLSGLSQLLTRLGISYKRGRDYVHSPDRRYEDKVSVLQLALLRAWYEPERYVFLYQDEVSFYRQPTLDRAYESSGAAQPLARRSHRANTQFRGIGALNAITGQVTYRQHSKVRLSLLSEFYAVLCEEYPQVEVIYLAQDNWPIHFHPDILARLQPQHFPFPPKVPLNWPTTPTSRAVHDNLPIQILCLPTYASWLNPIEKLWRWLKQEILHLHRMSDDWQGLKLRVLDFMHQFEAASPDLLTYVGLWSD